MATAEPQSHRIGRAPPSGAAGAHRQRTQTALAQSIGPSGLYWLAALLVYGVIGGFLFPPVTLAFSNKDVFQHLAAISALIESPWAPSNPFVESGEPSRLFGPVHVLAGFIGNWLNATQVQMWQAISVFSLGLLALGQYLFARAYFRNDWGPLALLAATTLGWGASIIHTGFHSPFSLAEGAGYPATIAIGGSLLMWALVIRGLEGSRWIAAWPVLVALMLANHPLGGIIGLIGAGVLWLLWPATLKARAQVAALTAAGVALAFLWPWYSLADTLFSAGDDKWNASASFYSLELLIFFALPPLLGLLGLTFSGWAMLVAFMLFYLPGLAGVPVSHRFIMPIILVLHIGVAGAILKWWNSRFRPWILAFAAATLFSQAPSTDYVLSLYDRGWTQNGDLTAHAEALRLPSGVAAYDVAAWPVVASGRRVLATPLPEPMIGDLDRRQELNAALFDPRLSAARRRALAESAGVGTLVLQARSDTGEIERVLHEEAIVVRRSGSLVAFVVAQD